MTNGSKLIMVAKRRQQVIEVLKIWYNYYCNFYHLFLVFYLFTFYWTKDNFLTFIIFCQMLFSFVLKRWLFLTKLSFKFKDFRGCFRRITINIFFLGIHSIFQFKSLSTCFIIIETPRGKFACHGFNLSKQLTNQWLNIYFLV